MAAVTLGGVTADTVGPIVLASLSLPGITARQSTTPLPDGGVTFTGSDVGESGTLAIEAHILGVDAANCVALADDLAAAWSPATEDREVLVSLPGSDRIYRGRPTSCIPVIDGTETGAARCSFLVADWRWYANATKSVSVGVAALTGGITTPLDTTGGITSTGSGSTGDASVVNDGTAPTPWVAYIVGPVTTPRLILGGKTIELLGDVSAGSTLVVNGEDGSVRLGGASRPWVSFESTWWEIPPGTSTFSFRAVAGTGTATLIWQDAST
jgi:hypothetical protein